MLVPESCVNVQLKSVPLCVDRFIVLSMNAVETISIELFDD